MSSFKIRERKTNKDLVLLTVHCSVLDRQEDKKHISIQNYKRVVVLAVHFLIFMFKYKKVKHFKDCSRAHVEYNYKTS